MGYHFLFFIFYFENVWFEVPFQFKLFLKKHNSSTYNGPLCRSRFTLNPKPTLLVLILFFVWQVGTRYLVFFFFYAQKILRILYQVGTTPILGQQVWGGDQGYLVLVPSTYLPNYLPTYLAVLSKVVFVFVFAFDSRERVSLTLDLLEHNPTPPFEQSKKDKNLFWHSLIGYETQFLRRHVLCGSEALSFAIYIYIYIYIYVAQKMNLKICYYNQVCFFVF